MFPSRPSVTGCHRSRCWGEKTGVSQSVRQTGRPPATSYQLLSPPGRLKIISGKAFCTTCVLCVSCQNKTVQTVFFYVNSVVWRWLSTDCDGSWLGRDNLGKAETIFRRDSDRPKYSDLDLIAQFPHSISKFGAFVLSAFYLSVTDEKL